MYCRTDGNLPQYKPHNWCTAGQVSCIGGNLPGHASRVRHLSAYTPRLHIIALFIQHSCLESFGCPRNNLFLYAYMVAYACVLQSLVAGSTKSSTFFFIVYPARMIDNTLSKCFNIRQPWSSMPELLIFNINICGLFRLLGVIHVHIIF